MKNEQVVCIDKDIETNGNTLNDWIENVVFANGEVSQVSSKLLIQIDEKADTNVGLEIIIKDLEKVDKEKIAKQVAEWISYTDFKKIFPDEKYGNIKLHYDDSKDLEYYVIN